MSEYIARIRSKLGHELLHLPAVSVALFDEHRRILLVREVEGDSWAIPGGMVEPLENPADAAVREMWEETSLVVKLTGIVGVFGGLSCTNTYLNGDHVSWVSTVFAAALVAGKPAPDGVETLEVRFFDQESARRVRCLPHVQEHLNAAYEYSGTPLFEAPRWRPDASSDR